jgi:hypothetical protein
MSKHPKVAMGMMFEHLRPMSLVQAYCTGKGTCQEPNDLAMTEILSGHQPHEALLNNFDKIDWSNVIEEASELMPHQYAVEFKKDLAAPKCESDSKVCPHCMMKHIKKTTKDAIMKVKAMCQETKCSVMQKMCPWMKENREVALGMLISKVEPWKIAKGWCMHKAKRHEWRHGHHEHGKWHHDHHEHGEWRHEHREHGMWHHDHHEHGEGHHEHHEHGEWHHGHHEHDEGHHGKHEHSKWHYAHDHGFKGGIWAHVHDVELKEPHEPKEPQEMISV